MSAKKRNLKQEALGLILVIFIALLFRSVAYEAYYVPSSSMLPNLLIGDRVIINKYKYGISRYSFPLSPPLFNGRIFEIAKPKRGDVIVFETDKIYIKRLIGLPGDHIQVLDGIIYINGQQVPKVPVGMFHSETQSSKEYLQTLPNNVKYTVLDDGHTLLDNTKVYVVEEDHYFFMGDNMDHSNDSRNLNGIGYVHKDNLIGQAEYIFFSSFYPMYQPVEFVINFRKDRFFQRIK